MLSNPPPSGLPNRKLQHRRQNSTPTAFETMKIANHNNLPALQPHQQQQQHQQQRPPQGRPRVTHRRGMSLDTRRQHIQSPTFRQEFHPTMQGFDGQCFDGMPGAQPMNMPFDMYQMNPMMKKNAEGFPHGMAVAQDFELFPNSAMSTPTFMNFGESPAGASAWVSEGESSDSRRSSRRISNGIMDRVAKFETLGTEGSQKPITPPQQNANDYFPPAPLDAPSYEGTIKHRRRPQRFMEGYDESMEETVKPDRSANRLSMTTFDEMRHAAEVQAQQPMPGPRRPLSMSLTYEGVTGDNFLEMNQVNAGMTIQTQFDGLPGPSYPLSASSDFSQHTTPGTPHMGGGPFDMKPDLRPPEMGKDFSSADGSQTTEKPSRRGSPHRRNDSVASIVSAASISTLDIEQTRTETGVTIDDIHQFIQGPEPRDNKWVCVFEGCNKRFGRKENIKSHVQTHLNDRQYKCPTCQKCFVRQHDLKRHAKIHTGIKPYPCECGNSFARHDALTRHKQRGMCIGAFDGVVRKVVKRGRPRKHRPDLDERKDKSTRTRKKNKSVSSVSSQSGYSDSSAPNSPENVETDFDMLDELMDMTMDGNSTVKLSSLEAMVASSSAPMPTLGSELVTSAQSPSTTSIHSYVSQLSHMSLHPGDALPSQPPSPAKSVTSQYNEPPELSQSSSPPSSNRFFDVDPNSSHSSETMISAAMESTTISSLAEIEDGEDDLLLQFTHGDPNMLMLSADSKFEDAFNHVNMYHDSSNDDVFFGSS